MDVRKTYKLFVGGVFTRGDTASCYVPEHGVPANVARAGRKDVRDAVVAARAAQQVFASMSAYHRGQVLYRLAEMMQSHRAVLAEEIGDGAPAPVEEVEAAIDLVVWYAGLCDKVQQLLGSQNAVSGPFFNFSTVEATGVVGISAPELPALVGLLAVLLPVLVSGNAAIVVVSTSRPQVALTLAELIAVSDLPGGVVNLLAGLADDLMPTLCGHHDVDGLLLSGEPKREWLELAAESVKRVRVAGIDAGGFLRHRPSLLWVEPFVETKTFWHPVAP